MQIFKLRYWTIKYSNWNDKCNGGDKLYSVHSQTEN